MPPHAPDQRRACAGSSAAREPELARPGFTREEAYARLAHTLVERLPATLRAEPTGLTPREVTAAMRDMRDLAGDTRRHINLSRARALEPDDQMELRALARALMQQLSELLRRQKVKDIAVIDLDDDWPLVRKRRAPLSDWDIWTLHTALTMLRRSYAMVTHAEAYAAAHPDQYSPNKWAAASPITDRPVM